MNSLQPYLFGRGRAGLALVKALDLLQRTDPELGLRDSILLPRETDFARLPDRENAVLCVSNPHGLHAETLERAYAAGFRHVLCEKPYGATLADLERLAALKDLKAAVFHGYRVQWGPRELRRLVAEKSLGELFRLEIRYWQSSAAQRALEKDAPAKANWKNDPRLSGPHDVLLDLATHALDLAAYLAGGLPQKLQVERLFVNAEAVHRDTHVDLRADFGDLGARLSASKTVHGAGNDLEVVLLGSLGSARWRFQDPDRLEIGRGREIQIRARDVASGSGFTPFHGLGWLEGYYEISRRALRTWRLGEKHEFPDAAIATALTRALLAAT